MFPDVPRFADFERRQALELLSGAFNTGILELRLRFLEHALDA